MNNTEWDYALFATKIAFISQLKHSLCASKNATNFDFYYFNQQKVAIDFVLVVLNSRDVTFLLLITVISMLQVHSSAIMCGTGF